MYLACGTDAAFALSAACEAGHAVSGARNGSEAVSRVVGVNGGRASRGGAQSQASAERVS